MRQTGKKALIFFALLFSVSLSMAEVAVPALKSRVTDLTGTLAANETAQLEQRLAAFEARKGSQIAVLIVPTTQPETIEQYSIRVAEAWKLGRKGIDDGALLLIAKQDRTVRIEVGYGLEGVLPDALAKRIVDEVIVPEFKQGNFAGGIDAGIEQMMSVVEGEPLPPQARRGERAPSGNAVMDNIIPGEILFAVEAALNTWPLLRDQSARERAVEAFAQLRVWDTEYNNGVLIYLLLADRDVEIIADRGINSKVGSGEWEKICREMEEAFRLGQFESGVIAGIQGIGNHLQAHFPAERKGGENELSDRPVIL